MPVRHRALTDIYLGESEGWVGIPVDVRQGVATSGGAITITGGRNAEGSVPAAGTANLVINNRSGVYSSRNPRSPYFGLLGRNTPIRIGVLLASDDFDRTVASGWGTATSGQEWSVSGGASSDFAVASAAGTHSHSSTDTVKRSTLDLAVVDVEQVTDLSVPAAITGGAVAAGHLARVQSGGDDFYWLRAEFNPGGTLTLRISKDVGGVHTTLAELVDVPGLTYSAGQLLRLRSAVVDGRLSARVWDAGDAEPGGWMLTATDTELTEPGQVGLRTWRTSGNSNTSPLVISMSGYQAVDRRATMEVPSWPPRWNPRGTDVWTPIQATGILQRLSKPGTRALDPAPARYLPTTSPVACWPLTDGRESERGAALVGAYPMLAHRGGHPSGAVISYPQWGRGDLASWLPPGVLRSGSAGLTALRGDVEMPGFTTTWTVDLMFSATTDAGNWTVDINPGYLLGPDAGGFSTGWPQLAGWSDVRRVVVAMNGEPEVESEQLDCFDGRPHHLRWTVSQSGANVTWAAYLDGVSVNSGTTSGAMTLPPIIRMGMAADAIGGAQLVQEYVTVWTTAPPLADAVSAAFGHRGETAAARLARLGDEEGVPVAIVGDPDASEPLGPQGMETFLVLAQQAAAADGGVLAEPRETLGLAYRTRASLYNQAALLEVDYAARHLAPPIEPDPDEFTVVNDMTVTRPDGAEYRAVQESGPLSVQDPPDGVGPSPQQAILHVRADGQVRHLASWLRHLGTWNEERYPRIRLNLSSQTWQADPEMTARAAALGPGRVMEIANLPEWMPPGVARQMAQGHTEFLDAYERHITFNLEPAGPYTVGVVEDDVLGRADTDGSMLTADFSAGVDTSMSVAITDGPQWINSTDYGSMFPFGATIPVAGVDLEVTGITAPATPTAQAGTVSHGNNTSLNPALPASVQAGDLLILVAAIRNSGTGRPDTPSGWTILPGFGAADNVRVCARIATSSESAPTVTFTSGAANATTTAVVLRFRGGLYYDLGNVVVAATSQLNTSAQDIAVPRVRVRHPYCLVLYVAWKQDDWTGVAQLSGATELVDASSTTGDDQGLVVDYATGVGPAEIDATSLTVTGGASAISRAAVIAIRDDRQAWTVTQAPVNGITKSIPAGSAISLTNPWRAAL